MLQADHIGYAVRKIQEAADKLELLGYAFDEIIKDEARNVLIAFGSLGNCRIELVAPAAGGSPVDRILQAAGPAPYHICYRSGNFQKDIEILCGGGYKIMVPPAPAAAFEGRRVVFLYSLAAGLVEIVEK